MSLIGRYLVPRNSAWCGCEYAHDVARHSFELPVVGIEYQVNPGAKCDVFLTQFRELNERVRYRCSGARSRSSGSRWLAGLLSHSQINKNFATIGWYHSHPGFSCFLSKTDCDTQTLYQTYQDPFVAVVVRGQLGQQLQAPFADLLTHCVH